MFPVFQNNTELYVREFKVFPTKAFNILPNICYLQTRWTDIWLIKNFHIHTDKKILAPSGNTIFPDNLQLDVMPKRSSNF